LVNSGGPETNYGFWFPGKENDGAAGWQFMSAKAGSAWMGSSYPGGVTEPRGPWHYDGEIDLGFGAALRMAATIVTRDPTFGWIAYGGTLRENGNDLVVSPRDGVRRRFDAVISDASRVKVELERDGFASDGMITLDKTANHVAFIVENRTGTPHTTALRLSARYTVVANGRPVALTPTGDWDYPWRADISMTGASTRVTLAR